MKGNIRSIAVLGVALAVGAPLAKGEAIYLFQEINSSRVLVSFDSATPGTISNTVTLTGFPGVDTTLFGIDFNPANGFLYGRSTDGGLNGSTVQINTATGVMTAVGSPTANGGGLFYGIDFDPTGGQYRLVSDTGNNRRFDAATGALVQVDTSLNGAASTISNIAYSNNVAGAGSTTLYGINHVGDTLVQIDGATGLVTTVGALGVDVPNFGGFDISGVTGTAYAVFRVSNVSGLYTINL